MKCNINSSTQTSNNPWNLSLEMLVKNLHRWHSNNRSGNLLAPILLTLLEQALHNSLQYKTSSPLKLPVERHAKSSPDSIMATLLPGGMPKAGGGSIFKPGIFLLRIDFFRQSCRHSTLRFEGGGVSLIIRGRRRTC